VWERLRRVRPAAQEIAGLSIAAVFRMMAMTTLFAVLGGAISFAVFLTSYMQVERMDAQNKLIEKQIEQTARQMELTEKQQSIDVALSIAERRQVTTREILTLVNNERPRLEDGKRKLGGTTANLIAVAIAQLEPYRRVAANPRQPGERAARHLRSPSRSSSCATCRPPTSTSASSTCAAPSSTTPTCKRPTSTAPTSRRSACGTRSCTTPGSSGPTSPRRTSRWPASRASTCPAATSRGRSCTAPTSTTPC
jgi:hypothetical protein